MYYEEAIVNGVLCFKTTPDGEWRMVSANALSYRVFTAESKLEKAKAVLEKCRAYIGNVSHYTFGTEHDHADYELLEEVESMLEKMKG